MASRCFFRNSHCRTLDHELLTRNTVSPQTIQFLVYYYVSSLSDTTSYSFGSIFITVYTVVCIVCFCLIL